MEDFKTVQGFLLWLTSTAGLGAAVVYVVMGIKKLWPQLEGWAALAITVVVALVLGGGATVLLQFGLYEYLEPYWGVIVAFATVVGGFGVSQLLYHKPPSDKS